MRINRIFLASSFLALFAFGLAGSNFVSVSAITNPSEGGTYTCKWIARPGTCTPVDNCTDDYKPGDACKNLNSVNCNDAPAQQCVKEGAVSPGTQPSSDLGEAGCHWEWDNFLNQSGKCKTKFECGTGATPKANLTSPKCEEIKSQDQCEDSSRKVQECVASEVSTRDEASTRDEPSTRDEAPGGVFQIKNPLKFGSIPQILDSIAGFLYALALAVVTIMVLWGGLQILTAAGNPSQIDAGKKTLLWAVIGTVVILIAGGIADLTANILGGKSGESMPEVTPSKNVLEYPTR